MQATRLGLSGIASHLCRRSFAIPRAQSLVVHLRSPGLKLDSKFFTSASSRLHIALQPAGTRISPLWTRLLLLRETPVLWSRLSRTKHDAHAPLLYRGSKVAGWRGKAHPRSFAKELTLRERFDRLPNDILVWGILGLNGAIFLVWQYAQAEYRNGNTSPIAFMMNNILVSWRNIREGRLWTIVTASFSHMDMAHFTLNALTFYFMAPPVLRMLGNTSFLSLYFFGGISCSVLSLFMNQTVRRRDGSSCGASGAIFAVASFFACVSPQTQFLLFFIIPMPAWVAVAGIFLWDGYSTLSDRKTKIDGAGHVGGILAGIVYYLLKIRGL